MSFVTYHPSNKQLGHFIGREAVYCNLNSNVVVAGVEGVGCLVASWVVKQSTYVLLVYVICPGITFASYLNVLDEIISLRSPSPLWPLPWQPGDHCPAAGEVTCVDMGECVMKSMAGRDHVGAFLVHGTCCVCRKVLVSSSMSKYTVIAHIVTTVICIYLYFISPIFIYLTYHFIQRNTCFNLLCVLSLWCTVLWILIARFICCTCQKWRNKDVQSNITTFRREVLKSWWDGNVNESRKRYPSTD